MKKFALVQTFAVAMLFLTGCSAHAFNALAGVRTVPNIRYETTPGVPANLQSLDIYLPKSMPAEHIPVLIWVHGGGWAIGDKSNQMLIKPVLFISAGYCLVSINYRLSPRPATGAPDRVMYPVHEQDVASAIAWVHAHIGEYGGDPERIALMGHSAGAHLVSIMSTDESFLKAHDLPLTVIRGTISLDTAGDNIPAVMARDRSGIYENAFGTDPAVWKQASPLYHVAAGKGMPPFLLVTRGMPGRRKQCEDFSKALQTAGSSAIVVDATGYSHEDVNRKLGTPGETRVTQPVMQFLAGCFGVGK